MGSLSGGSLSLGQGGESLSKEVSVLGAGGRVSVEGGLCPRGSLSRGSLSGRAPPRVNRMTDRCKNITLPQTSFAGGNEKNLFLIVEETLLHYSYGEDEHKRVNPNSTNCPVAPTPAETSDTNYFLLWY